MDGASRTGFITTAVQGCAKPASPAAARLATVAFGDIFPAEREVPFGGRD
jgi:hypothetical protein